MDDEHTQVEREDRVEDELKRYFAQKERLQEYGD